MRRCGPPLRVLSAVIGFTALAIWFLPSSGDAGDNKAPDFTLPNIEGKDVTLSKLLSQGPVILDFWATWCKPCIKAFPSLQKIYDEYKDRGLSVLAVSIDGPKSRARVGPFIKSKQYTFEVVLDTQGRVAGKYNTIMVPRTVLLNQEGEVVHASIGYHPSNHQKLKEAVDGLLPEPEHETLPAAGKTGLSEPGTGAAEDGEAGA